MPQPLAHNNAQAIKQAWMGKIASAYKGASAWIVELLVLWRLLALGEVESLALEWS